MRATSIAAAAVALVLSVPAGARADESEPLRGFSLDEEWNRWWRRVGDRAGRPDPDGPVQQRFAGKLYEEYELNLEVPRFPLRLERQWTADTDAMRMSLQSLNEFDLASVTQIKTRVPMSKSWRLGLAYDHLQNRVSDSDLFRIDFAYAPPGEIAPYFTLGIYPRYTKIDIEVIATAGYRHARWGDGRIRVFALDVFNDLSHALARSRDRQREVAINQRDPPLAAALELSTVEHGGVRGELYLGVILPHATTYELLDPDTPDFRQELSGTLGGALAEWNTGHSLHLGATALTVRTRTQREHASDPTVDRDVRERTHQLRVYALSSPVDQLELELFVRWTGRPETELDFQIEDSEWMGSARAEWMFSDVAGMELGFLGSDRTTEAPVDLDLDVEGTRLRMITRSVLSLGSVWAAFGINADLYAPGKGLFGGFSVSLIADL